MPRSMTKQTAYVALNISGHISADQPAEDILHAIRRQGALSIACHPHHRTTRRVEISTSYLSLGSPEEAGRAGRCAGSGESRRPVLGDKPEHYPYVASSDFHKPKHLYSWKTLVP
jgi:3',5'-nucleoside bisphosphate phosphatase